jgi:hypothetical protein
VLCVGIWRIIVGALVPRRHRSYHLRDGGIGGIAERCNSFHRLQQLVDGIQYAPV